MKLLCIDTTTEACSAALYIDGHTLDKYEVAPRKHVELILPMVHSLLEQAEIPLSALDGLAFARGPGAFTGIRICTSVIQGLAFGAGIPVVPVSTLATLAQGVDQDVDIIVSAIDARMNEIYLGLFSRDADGVVTPLSREIVGKPGELEIKPDLPCFGVGTGWDKHGDILSNKIGSLLQGVDRERLPRASDMIKLALKEFNRKNYVQAVDALPVYIRDKVTG